jgi:hypothetical protein
LGTGAGIYRYGLHMGGFEFDIASRAQSNLRNRIQTLESENQGLRESLARSERSLQMNETAYQELDKALKQSAKDIVNLREEISFYRNILSPENKQPGVRIQSLHINGTDKPSTYNYKLVVIQALKHDSQVRGKAAFEIIGLHQGKNSVLEFPDSKSRTIVVNFKYFQNIEGQFDLPPAFEPSRIKVTVQTYGSEGKILEREYPWPRTRT